MSRLCRYDLWDLERVRRSMHVSGSVFEMQPMHKRQPVTLRTSVGGGGSSPIFQMSYAAAAYPLCGWTNVTPTDNFHTRTHLPGGGPGSRDAIEMELRTDWLPWTSQGDGQNEWGWSGNIEASNPGYGASYFVRLYLRLDPTCNFQCTDWNDGSPRDSWSNKLIITQNAAAQRPIPHHGGHGDNDMGYFQVGLDGGDPQTETEYIYARGQWFSLQYQFLYSSANNVSDGLMRLWVDTDVQASPTITVGPMVLNPSFGEGGAEHQRHFYFGAYNNHGLRSGGVIKFQHAAFEVGRTFYNQWHASMAA